MLEPTLPIIDESEEELTLSPDATASWIKSLPLKDQLFIVSQGFQSFQSHLDKLVEEEAKELINNEVKKEIAQEVKENTSKTLLSLFSSGEYPSKLKITKTAEELNWDIQDIMEICE